MRAPLLALTVLVLGAAHAQAPLPERRYRETMRTYLKKAEQGVTIEQAAQWERLWRGIKQVQRDDATRLTPDHSAELASMQRAQAKGTPGKVGHPSALAKARFALRGWLLEEHPVTLQPSADPNQQAKEILSQEEYERARKKAPESAFTKWLREQQEKLAKWLQGLLPEIKPGPKADGAALALIIRVVLYVLAGLAVLFGILLLLRHGTGWRWAKSTKEAERARAEEDLTGTDIPDPLGQAHEAAWQGDYRLAVRLSYIACLRRLAERSFLTLERFKTNWEYQSQLQRRSSTAATTLLPATRLYETIWYGGRAATERDFAALQAVFAALPEAPP